MTWFVVYMANVAEKHLEKVKALLAHMHLLIQIEGSVPWGKRRASYGNMVVTSTSRT